MAAGAPAGKSAPEPDQKSANEKFEKISSRGVLEKHWIEDEEDEARAKEANQKKTAPDGGI